MTAAVAAAAAAAPIPQLEQTMRWFGPADPATLTHVRQAGATGVVTALHHLPPGEVWTRDQILKTKAHVEAAGLRWSVVESVPVHEDVKRDCGDAARYLDNYCQSLRNLAACGLRVVCYNFMAVTDWTRTDVVYRMPDGSEASRFDALDAAAFDLLVLSRRDAERDYAPEVARAAVARWEGYASSRREAISRAILMGLPGTVEDLSAEQFRRRLAEYDAIGVEGLRRNHAAFLRRVIPVAEECGVRMAIHPDDPPFPVFGLPRVACDEADLLRLIDVVDSPSNGITFCTGSLGASPKNRDLPGMLRRLGHRVHFLHLRNVTTEPDGSFFEADHLGGGTDMAAVMTEAIELMAKRGESLPMRPDHGRRMLGDLSLEGFYPGYSMIGRLRGLAELRGLEAGIRAARAGSSGQR